MSVSMGNAVGYLDLDISDFLAALKQAQTEAQGASSAMEKVFKNASDEISKMGKSIEKMGKTFSVALTTPITAGFGASVKVLAEFEQTMSRVEALSGATGDELEALSAKAQEMGAKTKYSANDAADAFTYMAQAGWKTEAMLQGIDGVMNLAASDGIALADASSIITSSLTGFGLAASDAAHFADVLAIASSASNTDVQSLGESFKYVAPVAGAAGYSIEDVATALGIMANNGIVAGQAGTSLRAIIGRLSGPSKLAREYMEELGISITNADGSMKTFDEVIDNLRGSFGQLTTAEQMFYATEIFGQEAMTGVLSLINTSVDSYDELRDSIMDSDGAAEDMAKTMQDNLLGRLEELSSAVEAIAMSVGQILMPYVERVVAQLQSWADRINALTDEEKEHLVQIAAMVAAIGPAILVIGKMVTAFSGLVTIVGKVQNGLGLISGSTAALSAPILAAVGVIGTLAAAFKTLWDTDSEFRSSMVAGWNTLKATFAEFVNDITADLATLGINWETVTNTLAQIWDGFCQVLEPIFTTAWNTITTVLSTALNVLSSLFGIFANAFTGDWEAVWNNVGKLFYSIGQGIWNTASGIFDGIIQAWNNFIGPFQTAWETAWNGVTSFFTSAFTFVADTFSGVVNKILDGIGYLMEGIAIVGEFFGSDEWAPALRKWSQNVRNTEIDIADSFTQTMDTVGSTIQTGMKKADDFFNAGWDVISGNVDISGLGTELSGQLSEIGEDLGSQATEIGTDLADKMALGTAGAGSLSLGSTGEDEEPGFFKKWQQYLEDWEDSTGQYITMVEEKFTEMGGYVTDLWTSVNDYINQGYEQQIDELEKMIESSNEMYDEQIEKQQEQYDTQLQNLRQSYANKEITDAEYVAGKNALEQQMTDFIKQKNAEKEASERQLKQKQDQLARKQFESNKAVQIAQVWINAATATMRAFAENFWPVALGISAAIASIAGVQSAAIAAQKYTPMFAEGGVVDRPTLGIFGEQGREAIVPLKRNTEWIDLVTDRVLQGMDAVGRSAYNITFNSPKQIDEIQASRLMKRTIRDLAEGF